MSFPIALAFWVESIAVGVGLYWHLRRQPDRPQLWLAALRAGVCVGLARAALASAVWLLIAQSGTVAVFAYAPALLALPEAAFWSPNGPVSADAAVSLVLTFVVSTMVLVCLLALGAEAGRRRATLQGHWNVA